MENYFQKIQAQTHLNTFQKQTANMSQIIDQNVVCEL